MTPEMMQTILIIAWVIWTILNVYVIYRWVKLERYLSKAPPWTFLDHVIEHLIYIGSTLFYAVITLSVICKYITDILYGLNL